MFVYSHVQLCIAVHGIEDLDAWSCMLMYSHVQLCIAMHGGRRLGCMVIGPCIYSCIQSFILTTC